MTAFARVLLVADVLDNAALPVPMVLLLEPIVYGLAFVAVLIDLLWEHRS